MTPPPLREDSAVCWQCIPEEELSKRIRARGTTRTCATCDLRRRTILLNALADEVDLIYRQLYVLGELDTEYSVDSGYPVDSHRGRSPAEIIQELVAPEDDVVADALVDILCLRERWAVEHDLAMPFYQADAGYVRIGPDPDPLHDTWRAFVERVKFAGRFFDPEVGRLLEQIFRGIESVTIPGAPTPVRELGRKGEQIVLHRGRGADNEHDVGTILGDPARQLAPPPRNRRRAGRMNAAGIAVFYGAFSEETCVAEVRPSVGGWVVLGRFEVTRPLRLLDLTVFDSNPPEGSVFRPGYLDELRRWRFLTVFHELISRPVQPHEEFLEYIPTQMVAEYLANVARFDGVIYASAQMGSSTAELDPRNVALFNAASIVAADEPGSPDTEGSTPPVPRPRFPQPSPVEDRPAALRYVPDSAEARRVMQVRFSSVIDDVAPIPPPTGTSPSGGASEELTFDV